MGIRTHIESYDSWFDLRAILVTLACLFGAAYSGYLLYLDIQNRGARTGTPMAKLERMEQHVRMKPASSFVWGNVHRNENFYLKDSIQTPPNGGASIRFNDGTLVELGENSLIVINTLDNLSLNFLHGSVTVRTQSGDSRITMGKDGKAQVEHLPVRLLEPEPLAHFFAPENAARKISFSWQAEPRPGQSQPDTLEISPDRGFHEAGIKSFAIPAGKAALSAELFPGKYFWRVSSQGKALTEPGQFLVEGVSALRPLFPTASEKVRLFGDSAVVQFRWSPAVEDLERVEHRIEISQDPQFRSANRSQEIAATSGVSNFKNFQPGTYYWRLASKYEDLTIRSRAEKFLVERAASVAITLQKPEENATLNLKKELRFSWSSEATGLDYRWQIRAADAPDKIESVTESSNNHSWTGTRPGTYQWRAQAVYHDQVVGESAWRSFSAFAGDPIVMQSPGEKQEFHYWTDPPKFSFKWGKVDDVQGYALEVASSADFKDAVSVQASGNEVSATELGLGRLKEGQLFWRVKGLDPSQRTLKVSQISSFVYSIYPLLPAPASAKPDVGSVINPLESSDPVISWAPVEGAEGYELTLKRDGHVVLQKILKEDRLQVTGLEAAKYVYSVRAIDRIQRKGVALPDHKFEINFGQTLAAPETDSPEVQ